MKVGFKFIEPMIAENIIDSKGKPYYYCLAKLIQSKLSYRHKYSDLINQMSLSLQ